MEITDIKMRRMKEDGNFKAVVSITLDNEIAVHDIKIIEGEGKLFLAMPSKRMKDGTFRDVVHPVNMDVRRQMEDHIIGRYTAALEEEV